MTLQIVLSTDTNFAEVTLQLTNKPNEKRRILKRGSSWICNLVCLLHALWSPLFWNLTTGHSRGDWRTSLVALAHYVVTCNCLYFKVPYDWRGYKYADRWICRQKTFVHLILFHWFLLPKSPNMLTASPLPVHIAFLPLGNIWSKIYSKDLDPNHFDIILTLHCSLYRLALTLVGVCCDKAKSLPRDERNGSIKKK